MLPPNSNSNNVLESQTFRTSRTLAMRSQSPERSLVGTLVAHSGSSMRVIRCSLSLRNLRVADLEAQSTRWKTTL